MGRECLLEHTLTSKLGDGGRSGGVCVGRGGGRGGAGQHAWVCWGGSWAVETQRSGEGDAYGHDRGGSGLSILTQKAEKQRPRTRYAPVRTHTHRHAPTCAHLHSNAKVHALARNHKGTRTTYDYVDPVSNSPIPPPLPSHGPAAQPHAAHTAATLADSWGSRNGALNKRVDVAEPPVFVLPAVLVEPVVRVAEHLADLVCGVRPEVETVDAGPQLVRPARRGWAANCPDQQCRQARYQR